MLSRCENCGRVYVPETTGITPLGQIAHLYERLEPGDEVPYGECNACGAFVYLIS